MSSNSTIPKINKKLENILIIGNGGRENSLAWAIQKNDLIKTRNNAEKLNEQFSEEISLDKLKKDQ